MRKINDFVFVRIPGSVLGIDLVPGRWYEFKIKDDNLIWLIKFYGMGSNSRWDSETIMGSRDNCYSFEYGDDGILKSIKRYGYVKGGRYTAFASKFFIIDVIEVDYGDYKDKVSDIIPIYVG